MMVYVWVLPDDWISCHSNRIVLYQHPTLPGVQPLNSCIWYLFLCCNLATIVNPDHCSECLTLCLPLWFLRSLYWSILWLLNLYLLFLLFYIYSNDLLPIFSLIYASCNKLAWSSLIIRCSWVLNLALRYWNTFLHTLACLSNVAYLNFLPHPSGHSNNSSSSSSYSFYILN